MRSRVTSGLFPCTPSITSNICRTDFNPQIPNNTCQRVVLHNASQKPHVPVVSLICSLTASCEYIWWRVKFSELALKGVYMTSKEN